MRLLCFIVVLNSAVGAAQPGLFDPDPAHLWNRLHSALWLRFDGVGEMFGADRLDPLLWRDTQALLVGESHERALQVLEEFAAIDGAAQGLDPQKKAVLQRDLWAVYDWLQGGHGVDSSLVSAAQHRLSSLLATAIRQLALSADEMAQLPDNYAEAVASGRFAPAFNPESPEEPFLPPDLFDPQGAWVLLGRNEGPVARQHVAAGDGLTRSNLLLLIRLPAGRAATDSYLASLRAFDAPVGQTPWDVPQFPPDTQLALVRQALLIDAEAQELPQTFSLLAVYPNPFNGSAQILLDVEWAQQVHVSIYDLLGQQVAEVWKGWLPQGRHALELRTENLASGVFICRVQGASGRQVAKIAHLK